MQQLLTCLPTLPLRAYLCLNKLLLYFLETEMAIHSSTLAWKIPWWRSLIGCSPLGRWGSDTTEWFHFHFSLSCMGEGNGNPLQCSCLENAGDGGAWWAAIYGVAQSQTRVKWLSNSSSREKQYHFNLYSRVPLVVKESTRLWNLSNCRE